MLFVSIATLAEVLGETDNIPATDRHSKEEFAAADARLREQLRAAGKLLVALHARGEEPAAVIKEISLARRLHVCH